MTSTSIEALETACRALAAEWQDDVATDPTQYGIARRFETVDDYLEFEFNGRATDEIKALARDHGVSQDVAAETLERAIRKGASLEILNAELMAPLAQACKRHAEEWHYDVTYDTGSHYLTEPFTSVEDWIEWAMDTRSVHVMSDLEKIHGASYDTVREELASALREVCDLDALNESIQEYVELSESSNSPASRRRRSRSKP